MVLPYGALRGRRLARQGMAGDLLRPFPQRGPSSIQDIPPGHKGSALLQGLQTASETSWGYSRTRVFGLMQGKKGLWGLNPGSAPLVLGKAPAEGSSRQIKSIPGGSWLILVLRDVQHPPRHRAGSQVINYLAQTPRLPLLRKAITPSASFVLESFLFSKSPEH